MFGLGFSQMIIGGGAVVFVILFLSGRGVSRFSGPTLVLRKLKVNETASDGYIIDIEGRTSGVIAWCLTVMGFDAVNSLKVTSSEITFKESSLFGERHIVTPLTSTAHTSCGYSKPIGYLAIGVLLILVGLFSCDRNNTFAQNAAVLVLFLIFAAISFVAYWLFKKMFIMIETYGGTPMGLTFKRSVIENVSVDIEKVLVAIELINKKVLEAQGLKPAVIKKEITISGLCPKCGQQNNQEDVFCVQCGQKIK